MNAIEFHLLLNHAPIIMVPVGSLLLLWGILAKDNSISRVALVVLLVAGLLAVPTYLSGESAHEIAENLEGVTHDSIHDHEESATTALIASSIVGLLALIGLILQHRYDRLRSALGHGIVIAGLIATGFLGIAAHEGGQITHEALHDDFVPPVDPGGSGGSGESGGSAETGSDGSEHSHGSGGSH